MAAKPYPKDCTSLKFYDTNAIESVNNDDEHVQLWKKKKVSN